ncbi:MAG: helix-turn-helix transcriptional regulator [Myxococcota bacterium]
MIRGKAIRARREAMGWSVGEVAVATRIPRAHLEALEDERLDQLPAGPYAAAYTRVVCAYLGIDESSQDDVVLPVTPPQGAPLWLVRGLAGVSLLALAGLLSSLAWERIEAELPALPEPAVDQRVVIVARRTTSVTTRVDDAPAIAKRLPGGERLELAGKDRIEVEVAAISDVRIEWNGSTVVPQGRQDASRRFVFVDDRGVQW